MNAKDTKKTQELAEQRRLLANNLAGVDNQEVQQNTKRQQQAKFYNDLNTYAKGYVEKTFGQNFDPSNDLHRAAYSDAIANVKARMVELSTAQQSMNRVAQKYTTDPHWNEINQLAAKKVQDMPYSIAVKIQNAIAQNDAQTVDKFLSAVKEDYYKTSAAPAQTQAQPAVTPPYAEPSGVERSNVPPKRNINYNNLGHLTTSQQAALASKLGFLQSTNK